MFYTWTLATCHRNKWLFYFLSHRHSLFSNLLFPTKWKWILFVSHLNDVKLLCSEAFILSQYSSSEIKKKGQICMKVYSCIWALKFVINLFFLAYGRKIISVRWICSIKFGYVFFFLYLHTNKHWILSIPIYKFIAATK